MHAGGTAHIVPVPGVMGVKDFALTYSNILERYKFERFGRTFFWQRQNYSQAVLCLGINPHCREQNCERHKIYGAWEKRIHINEQTSWLLFFVAFGHPLTLWLEFDDGRENMKNYCTKGTCGLEGYRRRSDHFGDILATPPKCGGGRGEIMTVDWAALPNFFYLKTVIKLHWQNWPKTKHFPYLWPPAAEGDQAFLRHLSRLKTEPAAAQMSFSPELEKKTPFDVSTSRHIVSELWLWLFMAACTLPNVFAVYKHFSSIKLKLDKHMSIQGVFSTVSPYFQYRNDKTPLVNEETLYFEYFLKK